MEKAYKKSLKVIRSCETNLQIRSAYNYIYLFWKLYENEPGCSKLYKRLKDKCKVKKRLING